MSVSHCLENYLCQAHVEYQVVPHRYTESAYDSARSAHVPTASVVKAIMLRDRRDHHFVMALIPSSHKLKTLWVMQELGSDLVLAKEGEFGGLFPDCVLGAIPGFGQAYNMHLIWDDELARQDQLYFEAGDHEGLIKIGQLVFRQLFEEHPHGVISMPYENYSLFHMDEVRGELH
jgi:Ala-tRNA(Pro) deacylase